MTESYKNVTLDAYLLMWGLVENPEIIWKDYFYYIIWLQVSRWLLELNFQRVPLENLSRWQFMHTK